MADDVSASVIPLQQPRHKKKAKTGAEPAKAHRQRKKASAANAPPPPSSEHLIPLDFLSVGAANVAPPVPAPANELVHVAQLPSAPSPAVTLRTVTPSRHPIVPVLLSIAALALAGAGVGMKGLFSRSL